MKKRWLLEYSTAVLLIGWNKFLINQKRYSNLVSDAFSVWSSALVSQTSFRGETTSRVAKCRVSPASFSGVSFLHRRGERETRVTREWLVTKRRGSRKDEKRKAKPVFSFPPSFARIERETSGYVAAISQFQKPSLWKWGQVQNLSYENQFYLSGKNQLISHLRLCTTIQTSLNVRDFAKLYLS